MATLNTVKIADLFAKSFYLSQGYENRVSKLSTSMRKITSQPAR